MAFKGESADPTTGNQLYALLQTMLLASCPMCPYPRKPLRMSPGDVILASSSFHRVLLLGRQFTRRGPQGGYRDSSAGLEGNVVLPGVGGLAYFKTLLVLSVIGHRSGAQLGVPLLTTLPSGRGQRKHWEG